MMASDLLRPTERAAIIALKGDGALTSILPAASIQPMTEQPEWPFIRLDATQAVPQGRGRMARAEVTFMVHSFAKARLNGSGATEETARDYAGRINAAVVEALQAHAYEIEGRRFQFTVRTSRLMPDGAERDAWHGIANVRARVFAG